MLEVRIMSTLPTQPTGHNQPDSQASQLASQPVHPPTPPTYPTQLPTHPFTTLNPPIHPKTLHRPAGSAAVWRTSTAVQTIYIWYALALGCFVVAALLLLWIFFGFPLRGNRNLIRPWLCTLARCPSLADVVLLV